MKHFRIVLPLLVLVCLAISFVVWHASRSPVITDQIPIGSKRAEALPVSALTHDPQLGAPSRFRDPGQSTTHPETGFNSNPSPAAQALPLPPAYGFSYPRLLTGEMQSDTATDMHPSIDTDGRGTWMIAWTARSKEESVYGTDWDIFVAVTRDNGSTWSGTNPLNSNARTDSGNDCGVQNGPAISSDRAGLWLAAWDSTDPLAPADQMVGNLGSDSDILYALSSDDGASWSAPRALHPHAFNDSGEDIHPTLTPLGPGSWLCVWESTVDLDSKIGPDRDLLYSIYEASRDAWSEARPLNSNADTDLQADRNVSIQTDGRGTLVAVWESNEDAGKYGDDLDLFFARSNDNGRTWSASNVLNSNATTDREMDAFPSIETNGEGRWIVVWVGKNPTEAELGMDGDLMFSTSEDDGRTWYPPQALMAIAANDSRPDYQPQIVYDGLGDWLVVWESLDEAGLGLGVDSDILITRSTDQGLTWNPPTALHPNATTDDQGDFSPALAFADGIWMAAFCSRNDLGNSGPDQDVYQVISRDLNR